MVSTALLHQFWRMVCPAVSRTEREIAKLSKTIKSLASYNPELARGTGQFLPYIIDELQK